MSERRRSTRQKSFLRGCIYFNKRRSVMDCLVRDISDAGARLIFSEAVNVPDVVELYIPQVRESVGQRRCDDGGQPGHRVDMEADRPVEDGRTVAAYPPAVVRHTTPLSVCQVEEQ